VSANKRDGAFRLVQRRQLRFKMTVKRPFASNNSACGNGRAIAIDGLVAAGLLLFALISRFRGGRSLGSAAHWHPVLRVYISPFTTSRSFTVRLLPPRFAGGIKGPITAA
jgi:hypothetical protein